MVDDGFQLPLGYETAKLREVLRVCPRNEAPDTLTKQSAAKSGLEESAEAAPASDNYQGTPWLQGPPESNVDKPACSQMPVSCLHIGGYAIVFYGLPIARRDGRGVAPYWAAGRRTVDIF